MLEKIDFQKLKFAIMNFFVWGMGFLAQGQYKRGLIWLLGYAFFIASFSYRWIYGVFTFELLAPFGQLMIAGLIMVSIILAFETYFYGQIPQRYD